jgi:hypothetical protein
MLDRLKNLLRQPRYLGRRPAGKAGAVLEGPDWVQASPVRIEKMLQAALAKPTGGWFCVDASREIGPSPRAYKVAGHSWVLWRDSHSVYAAPEACPHMGASLVAAQACGDTLTCPWHGLELGGKGHGAWHPVNSFDDGILVWIQLDRGEVLTDRPILPDRPSTYVDAVIRMEAQCEPEDIIANRLDPWHGAHYHPYSFAHLTVFDTTDDALTMRVAYRVAGPLLVEVDATFWTPDARTIVMTIVDGDGAGSVVETHATPISKGRTAMIEATLATSERKGFKHMHRASSLIRGLIKRSAQKLWVDDIAYAERRYQLRCKTEDAAS